MAKVLLMQFATDKECAARRTLAKGSGAQLVECEPRWPAFFDVVARERPDVIVIACSVLAQHAREAARYLGEGFNTRDIPVILIDVQPRDLEETRAAAPLATISARADLPTTIKQKLGTAA